MSDELNAVKTDVALIKKDVKQIERFFDKVDSVMSEMSDMTKSLAVQQKIMEHFASKLEDLEEKMEEPVKAQKYYQQGLKLAIKEQQIQSDDSDTPASDKTSVPLLQLIQ